LKSTQPCTIAQRPLPVSASPCTATRVCAQSICTIPSWAASAMLRCLHWLPLPRTVHLATCSHVCSPAVFAGPPYAALELAAHPGAGAGKKGSAPRRPTSAAKHQFLAAARRRRRALAESGHWYSNKRFLAACTRRRGLIVSRQARKQYQRETNGILPHVTSLSADLARTYDHSWESFDFLLVRNVVGKHSDVMHSRSTYAET
jgi:hypothetical protein